MRILHTYKSTYADGPGIRYSIYTAGCTHHCKGCHNPSSWNFNQGYEMTQNIIESFKKDIVSNPMITGITISGGDPMDSSEGLLLLLKELSSLNKDIWVFSGYTVEKILEGDDIHKKECLAYIDTLVDGRFEESLKDVSGFKGSSNQRYIPAKEYFREYILNSCKKDLFQTDVVLSFQDEPILIQA